MNSQDWTQFDHGVSLFTSRLGVILGPFHCVLSIIALRCTGLRKVGLAGPGTVAVNWTDRAVRAGGRFRARALDLLFHPAVMLHERMIHQEFRTQ